MEVPSQDHPKVHKYKLHQPWKSSSVDDESDHPEPNGNGSKNLPSVNADNQAQVLAPPAKVGMVMKPCWPKLNHNDQIQTARPPHSFLALIAMALQNAPKKKLTSRQIFAYVVNKFPFYRIDQAGCLNSLRHTLSVNDCFKKVVRDIRESGRGCYWTFDSSSVKMSKNGKIKGQRKKFKEGKTARKLKKTQDMKLLGSNIIAGSAMSKMKSSPALDTSPGLTNDPSAINVVKSNGASTSSQRTSHSPNPITENS